MMAYEFLVIFNCNCGGGGYRVGHSGHTDLLLT